MLTSVSFAGTSSGLWASPTGSQPPVQSTGSSASERITADIYTHVRAPLQSDAAERVAELILPE